MNIQKPKCQLNVRYFHILALMATLSLGVQSCSDESRVIVGRVDDAVQVTMRITAGEESALTRAVTETDRSGTGYENYIDVNSLHILFFNKTNDVFVEEFTPESVTPVDDSEYPQV